MSDNTYQRVRPSQGKECTLADEEKEVVEQEGQPAQAIDQATESEESQPERPDPQEQSVTKRKDADYNWQETRRKMAELERIAREQQAVIDRLSKSNKPEEDEIDKLSNDDILTVAQAKKLGDRREKMAQLELQRQKEEILRLKYPDIDQVLSPENIALFEQTEPELAESLATLSGDPVKMRQAAYKLIKKTVMPNTTPSLEKKKAEQNAKKPVSVQSVTKQSAIGNASLFENGLTPELKKQLYAEMQSAIKQG